MGHREKLPNFYISSFLDWRDMIVAPKYLNQMIFEYY